MCWRLSIVSMKYQCVRACSFSPIVCECMHARAHTYVPVHITLLTSWSSDIMSPWRQAFGGLQNGPAAPCQQHTHTHTLRNRSLVLHLGSKNTMPTPVAKQESLLLQTHTGASVIHASGGLRSGELTSLDRHRHSTEQRHIHGQECSAAFRENG